VGALAACGTVGAASQIADAEVAVTRAHASDGDKYAVYETTAADLYLQKAKEEQGHAHYSAAETLAEKSQQLAEAAAKKATQQRNGVSPPPLPRATITHQANEGVPAPSAPVSAPAITPAPAAAPASAPAPATVRPAPASAPAAPATTPAPAPTGATVAPAPSSSEPDAAPRTPVIIPGGKP